MYSADRIYILDLPYVAVFTFDWKYFHKHALTRINIDLNNMCVCVFPLE